MFKSESAVFFLSLFFPLADRATAQAIDAAPSIENRSTRTIADQISDPSERRAFLALYQHEPPRQVLASAKAFLRDFPQIRFSGPRLRDGCAQQF